MQTAMSCDDLRETQALIGWGNAKVAERMRVSLSTVEKWRSGSARMSFADTFLFKAITRADLRMARKIHG